MLMKIRQFWADESAATAIEFAVIAALISVVLVASVTALGTRISSIFQTISDKLSPTAPPPFKPQMVV
jgi:pilus assembly protein Flp/PilA